MRCILVVLLILFLASPQPIEAKRKLFSNSTGARSTASVAIQPRLRADHRALIINFSGLSQAKSVSYTLTYTSNGIGQGASGTIAPTTNSTSRTLLFGTCSGKVCRYHQNISGMKFIVTSNLKSGKKVSKSFRVKV